MKRLVLVLLVALVLVGAYVFWPSQQNTPVFTEAVDNHVAEEVLRICNDMNPGPITVGSQAVVPDWEWVDLVNDDLVPTGTRRGIEHAGFLTVKRVLDGGLLVEYITPGEAAGTRCPSGARFVISQSKFAGMTDQYIAIRDSVQREKALVVELLAQDFYGKKQRVKDWQWVTIVNPSPIAQKYASGPIYIEYGDRVGIGPSGDAPGGTIRMRGQAPDGRILYEYTARGNPLGTKAPSGTLFFE